MTDPVIPTDLRPRILLGHVLDRLREMPEGSVQMAVTSPPYWGLRAYGTPPQVWGGDRDHAHEWQVTPPRRFRSVLIELNPAYVTLARKRAGQTGDILSFGDPAIPAPTSNAGPGSVGKQGAEVAADEGTGNPNTVPEAGP